MNPRLGYILLFEGDFRKVNASIKNVSEFTAATGVLKNGDNDVTGDYIDDAASYGGNMLFSATIGGKASIPPGNYRYFISGTYGGKQRTWYWDILVLPKDLSLLGFIDLSLEDYNPLLEKVTIHEGDNFAKEVIVPGLEFTAAVGSLRSFSEDITATYCTSAAAASEDTLTTHNIGALASIPAGDYGYFLTGTYDNGEAKTTWYLDLKVLPKQGAL